LNDYNYSLFEQKDLRERFPDWVLGYNIWREYCFHAEEPDMFDRFRSAVASERARVRPNGNLAGGQSRVFVSHKQQDQGEALGVARIIDNQGYNFWLDVLDPKLRGTTLTPVQIAYIIEMALLNCTHVIALITPRSSSSRWIPYEYGRVKEPSVYALKAACWIHPKNGSPLPEYLLLGTQAKSKVEIEQWLAKTGGTARRTPGPWVGSEPSALPT